ncbi:MAG: hypothetical protein A2X77_03395 [Gammaproteobacteria bacterium GWE2_42_36]|nr:MAG: hypothetical protein A2X77_03395 [Gammaproteobacteria bacterium GWE2_42_36]HCU04720.1 phospholipase [Coxiellaceae bacterium]
MRIRLFIFTFILAFVGLSTAVWADSSNTVGLQNKLNSPLSEWFPYWKEKNIMPISFYKESYVLPAYFESKDPFYKGSTSDNNNIKRIEFKFQFSLKVPIWANMFNAPFTFYGAYTQLSFWQAYTGSPFFRESNYEPELFFSYDVDHLLSHDWQISTINSGVVHQSNGRGGELERSWNRVYAQAIFDRNEDWEVGVKPWWVIPGASMTKHNRDITNYLGHGSWFVAYNFAHQQQLMLESRNDVESGFRRMANQLTWSYPLTQQIRLYAQYFTGYGQSLIEYNHRISAVGLGFSFNTAPTL